MTGDRVLAKRSRISAHAAGVGERIRAARVRRGMTEAELACAAGVTCRQVRSFEAGASRIATPRLKAVAAVLGISEAVLRGDLVSPPADGADPERRAEDELAGLVAAYRSIKSPAVRRSVLRLIRAAAGDD